MTEEDLRPLNPLWLASILAGLATLGAGLWLAGLPSHTEWILVFIAIAVGAAVFSGMFFLGTNLMGVRLEARVHDETEITGANVAHITHIDPLEDDAANRWLERYVFTRNLFGGLLVPIAILGALFLFAR